MSEPDLMRELIWAGVVLFGFVVAGFWWFLWATRPPKQEQEQEQEEKGS